MAKTSKAKAVVPHETERTKVVALCANYVYRSNGISDYCVCEPRETAMRCVFFASDDPNVRCRYFEECVLPSARPAK